MRDGATGLTYFGARWYDAESGKFLSRDPIRDGWNWHAYVGGDPVNFVDPWGLMATEADSVSSAARSADIARNTIAKRWQARAEYYAKPDSVRRGEKVLGTEYGTAYRGVGGGRMTVTDPPNRMDCSEFLSYAYETPLYRTAEFADNPHFKEVDKPQPGDLIIWRATDPERGRVGHGAINTGESGDKAILHSEYGSGVHYSEDDITDTLNGKNYMNIEKKYYRRREDDE
jgi:hypothetical protein